MWRRQVLMRDPREFKVESICPKSSMRHARSGVKQKFEQSEESFSSSSESEKMAEYSHRNNKKFVSAQSPRNEHQFNCSADKNQSPGNTNKTDCFENLIKLLEDLKTTIMGSTKSGKCNLRESTIISMETVLNQIKSQLNESQMKAGLEGSEESISSAVSMIREVENSIKTLKRPIDSSKPPISALKSPSLNANSLEIPGSEIRANQSTRNSINDISPSPENFQASPNKLLSDKAGNGPTDPLETNAEAADVELRNSRPRQTRRSGEHHRSVTPCFKYSIAKKNLVKSGKSQQPSLIRSEVKLTSRNSDHATPSSPYTIQRKSQSNPPPENRKIFAELLSFANTDTDRKFPTVLSKMAHNLRRPSGRSPISRTYSPNQESVELCSRILKFCGETYGCSPGEVNKFQTCTPEELYEKISAMGPEGEEFLKNAQNYLDLSAAGRGSNIASKNDIYEEPDGRPSFSRKAENGAPQRSPTRKMSGDQNNFENDSIKLMLQDLRTSVKNLESKDETTKTKLDPEVRDLLKEVRNSLHPPDQMLKESDVGNQDLNLENYEETSPRKVSRKASFSAFPGSQIMTDITGTLNDIRQSIKGIESKDQSGPGPEVLDMLTDVRNTIKSISATQQEAQSPQPEVLSALEEIRATIYSVEERTQQAQERTNQEMMNMLDSVRRSILSVEASSDERAALKNQQIVDALKEMRESVTNLEERTLVPEKTLNPKVTSLLNEIRSSIKFMESLRDSQRNAADTSMMNVLQDIKRSLVSIEGKRNSTVPQRPSVNMFVLGGKPDQPEGIMHSTPISSIMPKSRRTSDLRYESGSYQEEINRTPSNIDIQTTPPLADSYVKKALDDIRQSMQQIAAQKPPTCDGTELKQSINEFKQEIRSLLGRQTESSPRYSERSSIRKLSENVTDIKTGMKSLIDNIPVIVDAARTDQPQAKSDRKAPSKKINPTPHEESFSETGEEKTVDICKKVLDLMSEMREESTANLPRTSIKDGGPNPRIAINSVDQLPSTFTFSFVGPQPPDINEPIVININGRNFKCSRI